MTLLGDVILPIERCYQYVANQKSLLKISPDIIRKRSSTVNWYNVIRPLLLCGFLQQMYDMYVYIHVSSSSPRNVWLLLVFTHVTITNMTIITRTF